jgi:SAM-dependent methyltransferase
MNGTADYDATTYGERFADIYDAWVTGIVETDATVALLADQAQGRPTLELGIGTGRVALPLAERGIAVHGIDASTAMVARLRTKPGGEGLPITIGDFADVAVEGRFGLIYVVFKSIFALLTQEAQVRCFCNVAAHLTPDGIFLIEAFVPDVARFDRGQRVQVSREETDRRRGRAGAGAHRRAPCPPSHGRHSAGAVDSARCAVVPCASPRHDPPYSANSRRDRIYSGRGDPPATPAALIPGRRQGVAGPNSPGSASRIGGVPMTSSPAYLLGGTLTEQERLLQQAEGFAPEARWLVDRLGVQPGWRVVDVGCGPLGILDLLSERVGPAGSVIGLEREPRFVAMGRAIVSQRGLGNVELVLGDATASELARASFDLAHERLVVLQQSDPARLVAAMAALVRPGGLVVLEDFDQISLQCYPAHPAWDALLGVFRTLCREAGLDVFIGRRLPELLRAAGLVDVEAEVHARLDRPGDAHRLNLLAVIESMREKVLARGLVSEGELAGLMGALARHLADPHTVVARSLLFQAWGRMPT